MRYFLLILGLLSCPLHFILAQQEVSKPIYKDWELDEEKHKLLITKLPKKLDKDLRLVQITYAKESPLLTDFFQLGNSEFYTSNSKAFKVNKCRYTGKVVGIDPDGEVRFEVEFLKGKLDGYFITHKINGTVVTRVFQNGKVNSEAVNSAIGSPKMQKENKLKNRIRRD